VREVGLRGRNLIKGFEGIEDGDPSTVNLDPYMDPVGIWTIGWGHAIWVGGRTNGRFLRHKEDRNEARALYPDGITMEQAEALLTTDLMEACRDVEAATRGIVLSDNQFDALVSFVFNVGATNFRRSTLLRLMEEGNVEGAAGQFSRWIYSKGRKPPGLAVRRQKEQSLFLGVSNA